MLLDSVDLKPCPNCDSGGAPCVDIVDERLMDLQFIRVYCIFCGTGTEKIYKVDGLTWDEIKQLAVDRWNGGKVTVNAEDGIFEILKPDGDKND